MALAWFRQAVKKAGWLALASTASATSVSGVAMAGESLPLLQVDPALLGARPLKPPPPTAPTTPTVPPSSPLSPPAPRQTEAVVRTGVPPLPVTPPATPVTPVTPVTLNVPATATQAIDESAAPTHLMAHNISGVNEVDVLATGAVELHRADATIYADRLYFHQAQDAIDAAGNVRLVNPESTISGPRLQLQMTDNTGTFDSPSYAIRRQPKAEPEPALTLMGLPVIDEQGKVLATTGRMLTRPAITATGTADLLEFLGEDHYRLNRATYSTCSPTQRDWEVVVDELDLDYSREIGEARNATVRFKDVPLFYTPWLNFALNNRRKSGFLAPTFGSTSKSGIELTTPWYWNIAPDMDATIAPRLMSKRGVQLNAELRYLGPSYQGQTRLEYLPDDQLAKRNRSGYAITHAHNLGYGFVANLDLNGVSDDNYFGDLHTRLQTVAQGNLLRQGVLSYGGPWYGAALTVQHYQTLQDPSTLPLPIPYDRLPQLTAYANRNDLPLGLAFNLGAEYVNFSHPTLVQGKRTLLYPQLSLPLTTSAFWVTPKLGIHSTHYALERQGAVPDQQSRTLPIASVDGGFVMERETNWFGQTYLQTLEPRAYYLHVPYRDQQNIPVFDTAAADFNYAQMFAENRYAGGDRYADANQLTLAVSSRLLEPSSGAELLRATLGQRYYFSDHAVTLPGEVARNGRAADLLAALSGQVLPKIYADFGWQYNPQDKQTERLTLGARYQPKVGQVLNTSYRFTRDQLEQIDVSGQWPLSNGWHGVGRYNYSLKESRAVEIIGGLELDRGCWVSRFVVQRLATQVGNATSAIFVQLELNDFSRIGSNPLEILRRNIPGYGMINKPTADPVFAAQ